MKSIKLPMSMYTHSPIPINGPDPGPHPRPCRCPRTVCSSNSLKSIKRQERKSLGAIRRRHASASLLERCLLLHFQWLSGTDLRGQKCVGKGKKKRPSLPPSGERLSPGQLFQGKGTSNDLSPDSWVQKRNAKRQTARTVARTNIYL